MDNRCNRGWIPLAFLAFLIFGGGFFLWGRPGKLDSKPDASLGAAISVAPARSGQAETQSYPPTQFPGTTSTATLLPTTPPTPTQVPTPTPTPQPAPFILSGPAQSWSLTFADEFNTTTLDPSRWTTCYWWDDHGCTNAGNHELEWYQTENVSIRDGALHLEAKKQSLTGSDGNSYAYTSGMLTTGRGSQNLSEPVRFAFQYGYAEIRAKAPGGKGLWPAFWLLPADNTSKPEIDVMEIIGDQPGVVNMSFHYLSLDGTAGRVANTCVASNYTGDWHIFAVDWEPGSIAWYVDGVECWRYADAAHLPAKSMYLLINLAVGGDWPGPPDANTVFPSDFSIDYVRVWQHTAAQ
ncbi:MAG: glycoside hydrolase family 16 protein [Anaerolineaceae bacterium]|nr:glycoside hydrolase family 16 protein [Anaerolineaceae bacterium]